MRFCIKICHRRRAFTVLELTVVICTIALLISLLLPAIQHAREQARRQQCSQNLLQIGIALRTYHDSHDCLPSGVVNTTGPIKSRTNAQSIYSNQGMGMSGYSFGDYGEGDYGEGDYGEGDYGEGEEAPVDEDELQREIQKFTELRSEYMLGWIAQILPQLGQKNVYRKIDFQTPQLSFVNQQAKAAWLNTYQEWTTVGGTAVPWFPEPRVTRIGSLQCPSRVPRFSYGDGSETHYSGCYSGSPVPIDADNDGLLYLNSSESLDDVPDGAATTILVGESPVEVFRSFYFGDHSSLRATYRGSLTVSDFKRYVDYGSGGGLGDAEALELAEISTSWGFSGPHNATTQFLFADGAVKPISSLIDAQVYSQLGSRNDGQLISSDQF